MSGLNGIATSDIPTFSSPVKAGTSSQLSGLITDIIGSPEFSVENTSNSLGHAAFNQLAQNELAIFSGEFSIGVGLSNRGDLEGVDGHVNFAIQSTIGVVNSNLIFAFVERTSYAFNLEVLGIASRIIQIGVENLEESIIQFQDILIVGIILICEFNSTISVATRTTGNNSYSITSCESHGANHDDSQYQCEYFFHCDFLLKLFWCGVRRLHRRLP